MFTNLRRNLVCLICLVITSVVVWSPSGGAVEDSPTLWNEAEFNKSNELGIKAYREYKYALAEQIFKNAIDFAQRADSTVWMSALLNNLGQVYAAEGKSSQAEIARREADALKDRLSGRVTHNEKPALQSKADESVSSDTARQTQPTNREPLQGEATENVTAAGIATTNLNAWSTQKNADLKALSPVTDKSLQDTLLKGGAGTQAGSFQRPRSGVAINGGLSIFPPFKEIPVPKSLLAPETKSVSPTETTEPTKVPVVFPTSRKVTLRLTTYQTVIPWEPAWEALRDALDLQEEGIDVTLLLDREGVRLANKHNTQEYPLHRGSSERFIPMKEMLQNFIDKGGTVLVSERWAKTFGLTGGSNSSLFNGVQLLSDKEMALELVKQDQNVITY